jgi:hypothetical protein
MVRAGRIQAAEVTARIPVAVAIVPAPAVAETVRAPAIPADRPFSLHGHSRRALAPGVREVPEAATGQIPAMAAIDLAPVRVHRRAAGRHKIARRSGDVRRRTVPVITSALTTATICAATITAISVTSTG